MEDYKDYLLSEGKSTNTITQYMRVVKKLSNWLERQHTDLVHSQAVHLQYFKQELIEKYQAATINNYINAIRHYFGYLEEKGVIQHNPTKKLKEVKFRSKQLPILSENEKRKLIIYLNQTDHKMKNQWILKRNLAIIYTMLFAGLRKSEVLELKLTDIDEEYLLVRHSKFEKYRSVPMHEELYRAIQSWLQIRNDPDQIYLFTSQKKGPLTKSGINNLFQSLQEKGYYVYPHMLRHYFATDLIRRNNPLQIIATLLGHSDINTTKKYLDNTNEDMKIAIQSLRL